MSRFVKVIITLPATLAILTLNSEVAHGQANGARRIAINSVTLTDQQVQHLETTYRIRIPDGLYWYDGKSGAWGIEGGPAAGIGVAGLKVGGPLRADASRGNTRVFVNGRELHVLDVLALQQLGPVMRGRYWIDAYGNCGLEGGPAFVNLVAIARAQQAQSGRSWSVSGSNSWVGGDGSGFLGAQFKDATGNISTWSK